MSRRGKLLTGIFLTLTALPIVVEGIYVLDPGEDTWPWTDLIVTYVPWEAALAVYALLAVWVPVHLGVRYWRRRRRS